jgi:competence protein ComEA
MKRLIALLFLATCLTFAAPGISRAAVDSSAAAAVAVVNVNTATVQELQALPGVGSVTAGNIVDYRTAHGKFDSPQSLLQVKGIGPKTFEKIRNLITVD